jgi:hypothetical protein
MKIEGIKRWLRIKNQENKKESLFFLLSEAKGRSFSIGLCLIFCIQNVQDPQV